MSRAILCRVGEPPCVIFIMPDNATGYIAALEWTLGGQVSCLELHDGIKLWSNRDGFVLSLALARRVLARAVAEHEQLEAPRIGELGVREWIGKSDFVLARTAVDGGLTDLAESDIRQAIFWLGLNYILHH